MAAANLSSTEGCFGFAKELASIMLEQVQRHIPQPGEIEAAHFAAEGVQAAT